MPAEALQVRRAGGECPVQVEARDRPPRPLPLVSLPGDHHDRPVEALDEAGGDDADHALVPALAPDHIAVPAPLRLRPALDDGDRLPEDSLLDHLPVAVQRLELVREEVRFASILGEHQMQRHVGPAEPPRCVDPRCEPERDRGRVDRRGIDACDPHQRLQARLLRAAERA